MIYRIFIVVLFVISCSGCTSAMPDRTEGLISYGDKSVKAMFINKKLDTTLDLTLLDFVVEESTTEDVIKSLGKINKIRTGQSAYSNVSVCYIRPNHSGVRFNAGTMSQGKIVDSIEVFNPEAVKIKNCFSLQDNRFKKDLGTSRGIKLGISKSDVLKLLKDPSYRHNENDWEYLYQSKLESQKCDGGFDISESYKLRFNDDKLIHFYITKITSC